MTTRLDRLVLLLHTGSTATVRKQAAQQLGQILGHHPEDLYTLLERVLVHLKSSSWETRVAAGLAIEAIGDQVSIWDPSGQSIDQDRLTGLLEFEGLDLTKVLERGVPLLASQGKEFESGTEMDSLDPKERLILIRKRLIERLGLGTQFMDVDFFDETDVKVSVQGKVEKREEAHAVVESVVKKEEGDPFAGMSARERNQAKRKMKLAEKNAGSSSFQNSDISSSLKRQKTQPVLDTTDPNTTVVQFKPKPEASTLSVFSSGDEWPFEGLVEKVIPQLTQLSFDLFSPKWETRHGAAIGLREIIKIHGRGYGRVMGLSKAVNDARNEQMLQDLSIRLLCVLCLDRFVDFVGDQAVIPVRETCSQTLAVVLEHCAPHLCLSIIHKGLLVMHGYAGGEATWATRHAALIGIKFWMAVRQDLLGEVLVGKDGKETRIFMAIVEGLQDKNDDVRAVSSSALLPITEVLVELVAAERVFSRVVVGLVECLAELDDLSSATCFVMELLASLVRKDTIAKAMRTKKGFFGKVVTRLVPFFRHSIVAVRNSVLKTLLTLCELSCVSGDKDWITVDLLRLIFQNFALEEKKDVLANTLEVWGKLIDATEDNSQFVIDIMAVVGILFSLEMSPIGTAFNEKLFVNIAMYGASSKSGARTKAGNIGASCIGAQDRSMMNQDMNVISFEAVLYGRIIGATALGKLLESAISGPSTHYLTCQSWILSHVNSAWGIHRILAGIVIQELLAAHQLRTGARKQFVQTYPGSEVIFNSLMEVLNAVNSGGSLSFLELQNLLRGVHGECTAIHNAVKRMGYDLSQLPPIQATAESVTMNSPLGIQFSVESAEMFLAQINPIIASAPDSLSELIRKSQASVISIARVKRVLDPRVYSSIAAAVVAIKQIPQKLNPIVRNLMASVKTEENKELQRRSAIAIANLIKLNVDLSARADVNEKLVKNLCIFLCSDVGIAKDRTEHSGTITFTKLKAMKIATSGRKGKKKVLEVVDEAALEAVDEAAGAGLNEAALLENAILHAGAEAALEALCLCFGERLFLDVPGLETILTSALIQSAALIVKDEGEISPEDPLTQPLLDGLYVLQIIVKYLHPVLYPQVLSLIPAIRDCLTCKLSIVRNLAATCIAGLSKIIKVKAMITVLDIVVPLASHAKDVDRQGGIEALYHLVEGLAEDVLPYLIFLMAPLLARMSDVDENVRFLATNSFAQLVKLAPLEAGVPNPAGFTMDLVSRKENERKFIGQLIGTEKVQEFEMPVVVDATLRAYQKEGVSWLAFLNRYGLHGILCDDMGLGKTLQAICIIAADSYNRAQEFSKTGMIDSAACPTLVVCPSPLVGHWFFEIKKYAAFMKSVIYNGDRNERMRIRKGMMSSDVVIVSYEVLRNDIEYFSTLRFNYCCLDEGHVIKNPSTKLTKAVKMVKAFHRLYALYLLRILSGTPVQNNVIDLWSLFDFLMPGFLGTEAQFNERFGKVITASRDAKSSSREQERGALALEALHKQVLPFLMRRMKEDVLEDLPPKIIQDYYCELSEVQKMLYEDFTVLSGVTEGTQQKGHVFQSLQYLRKLCNHPSFVLVPTHPKYISVMAKLKAEKRNIRDIENAPKLVALRQLLMDCGIGTERGGNEVEATTAPHRVLIFAQVKQMLDLIETDLFAKYMSTVTYLRLDGQISDPIKRHELVQRFNSDPSIDVLLLTTHVGGLGLNLTGADTVIFMEHDWNPMKDLQAMDRTHRIGQKRVVNVYRLITKGTLEEKIMGLQKFKMNISSAIINNENAGMASMETSQIIDLFSLEGGDDKPREEVEGLSQLWEEAEYEDLQVDDFLKNLQDRRT